MTPSNAASFRSKSTLGQELWGWDFRFYSIPLPGSGWRAWSSSSLAAAPPPNAAQTAAVRRQSSCTGPRARSWRLRAAPHQLRLLARADLVLTYSVAASSVAVELAQCAPHLGVASPNLLVGDSHQLLGRVCQQLGLKPVQQRLGLGERPRRRPCVRAARLDDVP